MFTPRIFSCLFVLLFLAGTVPAQTTVSPAEAEAQKCEDKIGSVRRDVLGKYDDQLGELQLTLQKSADLEGALAVRTERQRLAADQSLAEKDYVTEPKALRALQLATVSKMRDLVTQLVQESLPRLVEFKKQLTVAGKLDEAVNVRTAIERLQNAHVPITRADASTIVPVETILLAYAGDRARADKTYKGQRITVHGILAGYRQDPADTKSYQFYLTGSTGSGWVQCSFSAPEFRFREEKSSFGSVSLVVMNKDGDTVGRVQKGQTLDIRGHCAGLDEVVRLDRCDLPR
jgi:hypothetical protein